ncbi:MAG: peptide chain release factor N(5)-glutamine methyltransferase [Treponema sp.]|jgi:release factor glutamine methyltransferase|nr:peptide chain release factor N(5)-glutamine methyltransferase [Treponema sp.]
MNIRRALAEAQVLLKSGDIETAALDSSLLLAFVLQTPREQLYTHNGRSLDRAERSAYTELLRRRIEGESVAVLTGRREFYGLDFMVNSHVLVPRPDTETLVEAALEALARRTNPRMLDLCTGSGAVAIAVKHSLSAAEVDAADISPAALLVARENSKRLVNGSIHFFEGDLFFALPCSSARFDLITANPPYIPTGKIGSLSKEVRREPLLALDGGGDGLDLIRRIVGGSGAYLKAGGSLVMEADSSQMTAIILLLKDHGFSECTIKRDLAGHERVICGSFR